MTELVFFGTPQFAIPALEALVKTGSYHITVVTAPDKPAGRHRVLTPPPVKTTALLLGLAVLQPETLKDESFLQQFSALHPEVAVTAAYGKIIPKNILEILPGKFINIHPSILPKYRGPSPIQGALLNGETETGASIMVMDEEIDHGPILAQRPGVFLTDRYYPEVAAELAELSANLLIQTLPLFLRDGLKPAPQEHSHPSYTARLIRKDGHIIWKNSAEEIYNHIRALHPHPGTWTHWDKKLLHIVRAKPLPFAVISTGGPGIVAEIKPSIAVQTGTFPLELQEVQLEGSRAMPVAEFVRGHSGFVGSRLE